MGSNQIQFEVYPIPLLQPQRMLRAVVEWFLLSRQPKNPARWQTFLGGWKSQFSGAPRRRGWKPRTFKEAP